MSNRLIDDNPIVDIAALMFLEDIADKQGEAGMSNYLISLASSLAKSMPHEEYDDWDEFISALKSGESILSTFEEVWMTTDRCVVNRVCPYSRGVQEYTTRIGELPVIHKIVAQYYNQNVKPCAVNTCCVIHQTYRNFAASRITVGGKKVNYAQISVSNFGETITVPDEWLAIILEKAGINTTKLNMLHRKNACIWLLYI